MWKWVDLRFMVWGRGLRRVKSGEKCNFGHSKAVPWHAVTPGWSADHRGEDPPQLQLLVCWNSAVPQWEERTRKLWSTYNVNILLHCSVKYSKRVKTKAFCWPDMKCVTIWGAATCIPSVSSTDDVSSDFTQNLTPWLYAVFYNTTRICAEVSHAKSRILQECETDIK